MITCGNTYGGGWGGRPVAVLPSVVQCRAPFVPWVSLCSPAPLSLLWFLYLSKHGVSFPTLTRLLRVGCFHYVTVANAGDYLFNVESEPVYKLYLKQVFLILEMFLFV